MGHSPTAAIYAGIPPVATIIITMLISGGIAGLMALNPIMGDQHRLNIEFTAGAGFVGIAVALMGRAHPVGIVLAVDPVRHALSGRRRARLRHAGDHPRHDRRHPGPGHPLRRRARADVPARARAPLPGDHARETARRRERQWTWISTPSFSVSRRPSGCRCRCSLPALPGSIRSAPASSTSASRARCWSPRLPPALRRRSHRVIRHWRLRCLARIARGDRRVDRLCPRPRLCLDHPSRQPDRLRRRHQLPRLGLDRRARQCLVRRGRPHPAARQHAPASRRSSSRSPTSSSTCRSSA